MYIRYKSIDTKFRKELKLIYGVRSQDSKYPWGSRS